MRITKDHVPDAPKEPVRLPAIQSTAGWLGLEVLGVTAAVVGASLGSVVISGLGVAAAVLGAFGIGQVEGRQRAGGDGRRVAELTRERDAAYAYALAAGAAVGDRRGEQPAEAPAARPSAAVRGGGRPGAVGSVPADPLDAPLPGESAGVTA